LNIRVYYEDTDVSGNVYHSNYLNYCERARSEIFFSRGESPILEEGHFVVSSISAKFIKSARFGELLTVKTEPIQVRKASLTLLQTIYRDEVKIFEAEVKLAFLDGEKPTKLPERVVKLFN